jgi:hypothetical protein
MLMLLRILVLIALGLSGASVLTWARQDKPPLPEPPAPEGAPRRQDPNLFKADKCLSPADTRRWEQQAHASPWFAVITKIYTRLGAVQYSYKTTFPAKGYQVIKVFGIEKRQTVVRMVTSSVSNDFSLDQSPVYDVKGNLLKKEEVLGKLKVGQAVLVSTDGKMVDPRYLSAVKDDTLILVPPPEGPLFEPDHP